MLKIDKNKSDLLHPLVISMTTQIEDLKNIIGEVIVCKDDEPEVFVYRGRKNVAVYHDIYHCSLSGSVVDKKDIFDVSEGYALNQHIVFNRMHHSFNLKPVSYILVSNSKGYSVPFVFKVQDMRKSYVYAATILYEHFNLPKEIVDLVMWFSGCSKPKSKYTVKDFPFNFEREYNGPLPSVVSREQLKRLYELELVNMAIPLNRFPCYTAITDESFDYVYPNNAPNRLSQHFNTKEKMHKYIKSVLESFSLI
jgi:hypothetical protein